MKFLRDESGQTLVMAALSFIVLLGFAAFATDVGVLLHERRAAQTAADSAAIGGATEALTEGTPSSVTTGVWDAAALDASLNGLTVTSNNTLNTTSGDELTILVSPDITVPTFNSAGYVQAIVTHQTPTFFMKLFGLSSMNVTATAIASDAIQSNGCIYVQNGGNYVALPNYDVDMGGNSLITGTNCGVTVNGDINMGGNSHINAKFVAASGTIQGKNAGNGWSEGVPPQADPLAKLQKTANQPSNFNAANGTCTAPAASGMSCLYDYQGGNLSGTLPSNTMYVFDEAGGPTISGAVTGSNVTLYLVGNIPFDFSNNGTVNLTPPGYGASCVGSTNPYCGILLDAPTDGSANAGTYTCKSGKGNNGGNPGELYFDFGSSTTDLYGVVYAPYAQLFTQDKGASATIDTDLVIGNVCSQSSTLTVAGYSGGDSPLTRVGLVY